MYFLPTVGGKNISPEKSDIRGGPILVWLIPIYQPITPGGKNIIPDKSKSMVPFFR